MNSLRNKLLHGKASFVLVMTLTAVMLFVQMGLSTTAWAADDRNEQAHTGQIDEQETAGGQAKLEEGPLAAEDEKLTIEQIVPRVRAISPVESYAASGTEAEVYVDFNRYALGGIGTEVNPTTWQKAWEIVAPGGIIYIMGNGNSSSTKSPLQITSDTEIDGRGVTIKPYYGSTSAKRLTGPLLLIQQGADVTISNLTFDGDTRPADYYYDFIYVDDGTLTLDENTVVQNFINTNYGAAINVYSGATVNLNGAVIKNNRTGLLTGAGGARGGVSVGGGATLNIQGVTEIVGNGMYDVRSCNEDVYVSHGGNVMLDGTANVGNITYNAASKTNDDRVYITSEMKNQVNIHSHQKFSQTIMTEALIGGNILAEGINGYMLTNTDIQHIKMLPNKNSSDYSWHADKNNLTQAYVCSDSDVYIWPKPTKGTFILTSKPDFYNQVRYDRTYTRGHREAVITIMSKPDKNYSYQAGTITVMDDNNVDIIHDVSLTQVSGKNQWTIIMPNVKNINISGKFVEAPYTLTVTGGTGSGKYGESDQVEISAPGMQDKKFTNWKINSGSPVLQNAKSAVTTLIMPAGNVDITAVYEDVTTHKVDGTINGIVDAGTTPTAVLIRDGTVFPAAVSNTGASTHYYYNYVPSGKYNLVVTAQIQGKEVTVTALVTVENADVTQNMTLPDGDYNSKVTSTGTGTPNIEGGELDKIAQTLGTSAITDHVLVELKVEKNDASVNAADVTSAIAADKLDKGIVMDLDLFKSINKGTPEKIRELNQGIYGSDLITVIFHLPVNLSGKDGYAIYRYHGTQVDKITEAANANGEHMSVDADKTTITAHLGRFSTYAIAYKETNSGGGTSGGSSGGNGKNTYPVNTEANKNGSINSNQGSAAYGETVTITVKPDKGYTLDKLVVKGTDGKTISVQNKGSNIYTFTMPSNKVTVTATFSKQTADLSVTGVSDWLITDEHIAYMKGDDLGNFNPTWNMTRAEAAQIFYNLLKDKETAITVSFYDVPDKAWYARAVNMLTSMNIISGFEGQYRPHDSITRGEFTSMAMRFARMTDGNMEFSDVSHSSWAYKYIAATVEYGWINGYEDNTFRSDNSIARAEVSAIINHMLVRIPDTAYIDANMVSLKVFPDAADSGYWAWYHIVETTNAHEFTKSGEKEVWTS